MIWRLLRRGWHVFVPVVLVNALLQAALVFPFLTPAFSPLFVLLALASGASLIASAVFVLAAVVGTRVGGSWRLWAAASLSLIFIGAAALLSLALVPFAIVLALIVLPGVAEGSGIAGFRSFRYSPWRSVGLLLLTLVLWAVLWLAALLLGFLITGPVAAALAWLLFGAVGVWLVCAWSALITRTPHTSPIYIP